MPCRLHRVRLGHGPDDVPGRLLRRVELDRRPDLESLRFKDRRRLGDELAAHVGHGDRVRSGTDEDPYRRALVGIRSEGGVASDHLILLLRRGLLVLALPLEAHRGELRLRVVAASGQRRERHAPAGELLIDHVADGRARDQEDEDEQPRERASPGPLRPLGRRLRPAGREDARLRARVRSDGLGAAGEHPRRHLGVARDGPAAAHSAELVGHLARRAVPERRILGERPHHDLLEPLRHEPVLLPDRRRRVGHLLHRDLDRGVAGERQLAGQHLVEHDPHRVEVGLRPDVEPARLLGREVLRGAHDRADLGHLRDVRRPGDAEVRHLEPALVGQRPCCGA